MTEFVPISGVGERQSALRRLRSAAAILMAGRGTGAAAAQTMLVRVLILGMNVLTGILSARLLGSAGKGEQTAIALWPQLIPWCLTLGLPTSLVYSIRRTPQKKGNLFAAALLLSGSVGLIAGVIGCIAVPYWLGRFDSHVVLCSQVLMLIVPLGMVWALAQSVMEAHGKFAVENALVFASALLTVCWLVGLGIFGVANPVTVAIAYIAGGTPAGIVGIGYAARLARPAVRDFIASARTLLHYGLRQYGSDLLGALSGNIDQFLVVSFLPPRMVGIYVVSVNLCRMLSLIQQSIAVVLFPKIVGQPLHAMSENVQRAARINVAISLLPALVIGLGGVKLIQWVYGHDFVASDILIWLILSETLLGGMSRLLAQTMMAIGRPGLVTLVNSAQFAISIPLSLILLPKFEMTGVAAAMLIGTMSRLVLMIASYSLILGLGRPQLLLSYSDLRSIYARLRAAV
jgi:enterobacterial common antigen flippase